MSEKETCFVFYQRWYTQISLLPEQDQLQLFKAICDYVFCGTKAELNVYLEAIMVNIRIAIDKDKDKQQAFIEQRKKAIQSRWDKYQKKRNTENTSVYNRIQPNTSEQSRNTNLYYNKNKNKEQELKQEQEQEQEQELKQEQEQEQEQELKQEQEFLFNDKSKICLSNLGFDENGNEIKNEDNSSSENGREGNTGQEMTEEEKKQLEEEQKQKEKEKRLREEEKKKKAFARIIVDFFNEKVKENKSSLKPVVILTKKRIEHITARANDFYKDAEANIKEAIINATTSPFLNGANPKGWIASFDWVFLPNNFVKVLEGNYNQKNNGNYQQGHQSERRRFETNSTTAKDYEGTF